MTDKKMIESLRKRLRVLSVSQLATELGYRSPNTVALWLEKEKIPATAKLRVEQYFEKLKKEQK